MPKQPTSRDCPDCNAGENFNRRDFMLTAGAAAALAGSLPVWAQAKDTASTAPPETIVKSLFDSMSEAQKKAVCFDWDYQDPKRGLLRTHVSNNWKITNQAIESDFYTKDQQAMIREIFDDLIDPDWHKRIAKQLEDDAGGYGKQQSIAIFGKPGESKFEFVMTGRHMTIRCDGHSAEHVAFGGPVFYGHAAQGFNEKADHPGNVFWPQALAANKVFQMLDGKQQKLALIEKLPKEDAVGFRGNDGMFPGIPITELSGDQKEEVQAVLAKLVDHYRKPDQDDALKCLKAQGGLDKCSLAFYSDGDIGNDKVWDCWRLEGPSFVWYFRGSPHVHVWVNVADDAAIKTNARG